MSGLCAAGVLPPVPLVVSGRLLPLAAARHGACWLPLPRGRLQLPDLPPGQPRQPRRGQAEERAAGDNHAPIVRLPNWWNTVCSWLDGGLVLVVPLSLLVVCWSEDQLRIRD